MPTTTLVYNCRRRASLLACAYLPACYFLNTKSELDADVNVTSCCRERNKKRKRKIELVNKILPQTIENQRTRKKKVKDKATHPS